MFPQGNGPIQTEQREQVKKYRNLKSNPKQPVCFTHKVKKSGFRQNNLAIPVAPLLPELIFRCLF